MIIGTVTKASVTTYSQQADYTLVLIDGIPDGFSFKKPDLQIGDKLIESDYIAFLPLHISFQVQSVTGKTIEELLENYKKSFRYEPKKSKKKNGEGFEA